jgi:uncharacterized coiled-coil DUF342 family protein
VTESEVTTNMTPEEIKRLTDAEEEIKKLKNDYALSNKALVGIQTLLEEIKDLLIGSISDTNVTGLVTQVKEAKKEILILQNESKKEVDSLHRKVEELQKALTDTSEEIKKYKWFVRGVGVVVIGIIVYGIRIWEFVTSLPKKP